MRSLLDANVLIALVDPDHAFYTRAHSWMAARMGDGWASCPLTQNALIRIVSSLGYSMARRFSVGELTTLMTEMIGKTDHEFWPDHISLLDSSLFAHERILGPRQITDIYLLALATKNGGRLVTFDERIPLSSVNGATSSNLCVI